MKVADIAKQHAISEDSLVSFINHTKFPHQAKGLLQTLMVEDSDVQKLITSYKEHLKTKEQAAQKQKEEKQRHAEQVANLPITSGHTFEGYKIVRYGGYISGDEMLFLDPEKKSFWLGMDLIDTDKLVEALKSIRRVAIKELKEAALNVGCNAIIGLDFDYVNLEVNRKLVAEGSNKYIGLTANGTAVQIEKI